MANRSTLTAQKSGVGVSAANNDHRTKILQCLTRLNDKATLQKAAEELSAIIRALDQESLAALVQSICSTGAWEPKPFAKKECIRALGQLPLHTCPAADTVLQQHLGKILGHLKKQLQDTDSLVREAAGEALSAYALAITTAAGGPLQGSISSPIVKVVFDCLAEQKKEAQLGASQALLMIAPCIGPLDKDLVKLILRLLKSATFQGTAALLAAIASSNAETHAPAGLLKSGPSAFLPYLNHLIGQPSSRRSSSGFDPGTGNGQSQSSSTTGSGIISCLASKDWAVRRAAADTIRTAVLLLGPAMEPEGCWSLSDPGSLTYRCLNALESQACKFDKVREARDAARDAAALLHELHLFVSERGPDGDWSAWIGSHVAYSGCVSPPKSCNSPRHTADLSEQRCTAGAMRISSPISQRFQQAAVQDDVIAEPGGFCTTETEVEAPGGEPVEQALTEAAVIKSSSVEGDAAEAAASDVMLHPTQLPQQQSSSEQLQQERSSHRPVSRCSSSSSAAIRAAQVGVAGNLAAGRTAAGTGSRPGSATGSRRTTAEQRQDSLKKQASSSKVPNGAAIDSEHSSSAMPAPDHEASNASNVAEGTAAAAEPQPPARPPSRTSSTSMQRQLSRQGSSKGRSSAAPTANTGSQQKWVGPTQQEWQQVQQQLEQYQQQQAVMASSIQQLQEQYTVTIASLQDRIACLELQQQQQLASNSSSEAGQFPTAPLGPGSPSRLGRTNSSSTVGTAPQPPQLGQSNTVTPAGPAGPASRQSGRWGTDPGLQDGRMFCSEDWTTPTSAGGALRRPGLSVLDTLSSGYRSNSGANTPTSSGGGLRAIDSQMQTPSDLDSAYSDALRGDKGEVHLLRLIQKTGPVWGRLSSRTCRSLLAVFIKNIKDGVMLHRVLPWLWRLADEDAGRPELPVELQQQLLDALHSCPAAEDLQTSEKVVLLESTLRAVWGHK